MQVFHRVSRSARTTGICLVILLFGFVTLFFNWERTSVAFTTVYQLGSTVWDYDNLPPSGILPNSNAFVVSLPSRTDRRHQMETLRKSLGFNWRYVDAVSSNDTLISAVFSSVRDIRHRAFVAGNISNAFLSLEPIKLPFSWPDDLTERVISDPWSSSMANVDQLSASSFPPTDVPLTCAQEDFNIPPFEPTLPRWLVLTSARIACWQSHLNVIRSIVQANRHTASIILEDDVDMERDITSRLGHVWPSLPHDWDIVFLGHCWTNETLYPPISPVYKREGVSEARLTRPTRLYPSHAPKCTHAYALSPGGARRILAHLLYPPFAHSRAIDQAFAWLIESGRIKGFSIVPSIVIQRKILASDVAEGTSLWQDYLDDGVFGNLTM